MLDAVAGEIGEDEREQRERETMVAAHLDRGIDGTATGRCCLKERERTEMRDRVQRLHIITV